LESILGLLESFKIGLSILKRLAPCQGIVPFKILHQHITSKDVLYTYWRIGSPPVLPFSRSLWK